MSSKVFQDNIFPRHISDLMSLMHMVVFKGTDGEEKWQTYLDLKQKEYIALGLSQYYDCEHCVEHHLTALCELENIPRITLSENINAMVLFLRIDTRNIGIAEKQHWVKAWKRFSYMISLENEDNLLPHLIGLAIGVARNDNFLIHFCGSEVKIALTEQGADVRATIGELESLVIFMKAAASRNRVVDKIEMLCDSSCSDIPIP